ncbi:MAG: GNAT family N-acetyltransferase [Anaerolineales bacterium]
MNAKLREYNPDVDFLRVRDFLSETYQAFGKPLNWRMERWNWARYHPLMFDGDAESNIQLWEKAVGLWENAEGEIVGVVNVELPRYGEAYVHRRPGYDSLLDEMVAYAEANLLDRDDNSLSFFVYEHDTPFQKLLRERGYQQHTDCPGYDSEFVIEGLPEVKLPEGFVVQSMAEGGDLALRCKVMGLGFDHPDPAEWTTPAAYERVQQAPDYRPELDLYVRAPDGEYVSCCIVWYDARNRMGIFEPVCTHPAYRRMGMGRAVMMEGMRRVAALSAETAQVGSGLQFYEAIGFRKICVSYRWSKAF